MKVIAIDNVAFIKKDTIYDVQDILDEAIQVQGEWFYSKHFKHFKELEHEQSANSKENVSDTNSGYSSINSHLQIC